MQRRVQVDSVSAATAFAWADIESVLSRFSLSLSISLSYSNVSLLASTDVPPPSPRCSVAAISGSPEECHLPMLMAARQKLAEIALGQNESELQQLRSQLNVRDVAIAAASVALRLEADSNGVLHFRRNCVLRVRSLLSVSLSLFISFV